MHATSCGGTEPALRLTGPEHGRRAPLHGRERGNRPSSPRRRADAG